MRNSYNAVLVLMTLLILMGSAYAQNMPNTGAAAPAEAAAAAKLPDPVMPSAANDNGARTLMQFAANNDDFDKTVTDMAKALYHRQIAECQDTDQVIRQLPTPYGPLTFPTPTATDKFPAPYNGVWIEHVKIRGCGKIFMVNILAVGQNTGAPPVTFGLLAGETLSDPGQQGNVLHMASQAIRHIDATCSDDPKPAYTQLLGYKQQDGSLSKTDAHLGWFEQWSFKFCQKDMPVQIAFMPDGNGGYDIKTRVAGAEPPAAPAPKPIDNGVSAPAQTQQK